MIFLKSISSTHGVSSVLYFLIKYLYIFVVVINYHMFRKPFCAPEGFSRPVCTLKESVMYPGASCNPSNACFLLCTRPVIFLQVNAISRSSMADAKGGRVEINALDKKTISIFFFASAKKTSFYLKFSSRLFECTSMSALDVVLL